ncbi:hypothetical protein [Nonomuraea sp. NPDC050691]|uniref:hypothetical protein n=1 Tax=Nonomuraea sp. NPDC050691 TaxID=3155661 RepID=UPI0033F10FA2
MMNYYPDDGRFPLGTRVEVRYPLTAGHRTADRTDWPWVPGEVMTQIRPDQWQVVVTVPRTAQATGQDREDDDATDFLVVFRHISEIKHQPMPGQPAATPPAITPPTVGLQEMIVDLVRAARTLAEATDPTADPAAAPAGRLAPDRAALLEALGHLPEVHRALQRVTENVNLALGVDQAKS